LSQQNQLMDRLRDELSTAREEKNQTEQRLSDQSTELETVKRECDEVKKSCEVISFNFRWGSTTHGKRNILPNFIWEIFESRCAVVRPMNNVLSSSSQKGG